MLLTASACRRMSPICKRLSLTCRSSPGFGFVPSYSTTVFDGCRPVYTPVLLLAPVLRGNFMWRSPMWGMADDPGIGFLMSGVAVGETIDYQESPSEEGVGTCISRLKDAPCVPLLSPQEFLVPPSMSTEKIEHTMTNEYANSGNGSPLTRQMTVALTPEQYERLFFQPEGPRRGDLSKRFANPTLLGLLGFLIPYTSTIFTLCGLRGAVAPTSLIGLNGDYYFLGAIAMNLAGIAEFILGNTFPMAVFIIYGCHWGSLAYTQDPIHNQLSAFGTNGALGAEWNSSQGFHNVTMVLVSFVFLVATFRVNAFFVATFFGLVMMFSFIAAADFAVPHIKTAADLEHVSTLLKIGGGFGWLGLISGWYLAILTACAAVGIPCPLPVLDLSSKVFSKDSPKEGHKDA
ncbi:hypothetical protein D6C84_06176 [Aureobasidium pullulans]|uniref:GPR1/FUN34/YaaH-class plasma membrane protein-like protein n=1 Tax=Aureobasidium pullulans TaxID=5580 RepID=A0A4S9XRQ4_AURPU|nr:hypothetical protein D6C84_06176 [Aureobasidium pullulans]